MTLSRQRVRSDWADGFAAASLRHRRCPDRLFAAPLPRLVGVGSDVALSWLREGQAFVTSDHALIGERLLRWDFEHLLESLPPRERFGVYMVKERLCMSHSLRGGLFQAAEDGAVIGTPQGSGDGAPSRGGLEHSAVRYLTFAAFLEASAEHERADDGRRPYLGIDLFRRESKRDAKGSFGPIGEALRAELEGSPVWSRLQAMARRQQLPVCSSVHLFVGGRAIVYHLHYDHNPNLHLQLVGRKRFLLFPPEEYAHLYPFPIFHDFDRRSMLNLDAPDAR